MSDGINDAGLTDVETGPQDAESELAELAAHYDSWAGDQLKEALQALEAARAMPSDRKSRIQEIFSVTHDMKGQGTTFGYDLITLIGALLCDFIRDIPDATDAELDVVEKHLGAMAVVLENRIKGSGGDFADKIKIKLEGIVASVRG